MRRMPAGSVSRTLALLLSALVLSGCLGESAAPSRSNTAQSPDSAAPDPECVEPFDPQRDYFPDKIEPRHARQFRVEYHRHFKLVTVSEPWAEAKERLRYLLLQCGTPRPEGYEDFETVEIPARGVVTTSTTELPHIVRLGLTDRLLGHDEFDWVSSPEIRRRIESDAMVEVGSGSSINIERVIASGADLLLIDSFGDPGLDLLGKLREVDIPVALVPSFLETTALGRAEWVLYTSLFFNRERRAEQAFREVEEGYEQVAAAVRAAAPDQRPTVFTSAPVGEVWHVPGGQSFFALMLADAGARYLWSDDGSTGSLPLAIEKVYETALDADVWLHPSSLASLAAIRAFDERFADLAAFSTQRVYGNDAQLNPHGGNAYWEIGTARPDWVLADLVEIFHPGLLDDHQLVFHRRLPEQ